jgi:hypothetical protein
MITSTQNLPPLAVHFIWHPSDKEVIFNVISEFRRYITRDTDRPFSREINIPTFLYSSRSPSNPPKNTPPKLANKNVIFVFTSGQTLTEPLWVDYFNRLNGSTNYFIVPVAIDEAGMKHSYSGALENYNFIRAHNWPHDYRIESGILELSHELYRYGLNDIDSDEVGKETSIKLFLSHAKKGDTGLNHAQEIKSFIDNSNMNRFFDANEISPGFKFDEEIESHLKNSTMIAIVSDAYSSRYWCQREVLTAKSEYRPIVVVNSLEDYEDRIFPSIGNVPCVHVTAEPLAHKDILRILIASLLETVRFKYAEASLKFYQSQGWIDSKAFILCRPPEVQQVVEILSKNESSSIDSSRLHLCYPEPPLYEEETIWTDYLNITVSTPLWSSDEVQTDKYNVGISISDYLEDGYEEHHQHTDELQRLSQDLARHILSRNHTLIYGGDLRENGFTEFVLEEASVLKERLKSDQFHVENHLAWPLYLTPASKEFSIKYYGLLDIVKHEVPDDIDSILKNKEIFLKPDCPENQYIWSRCLTTMRKESIESSDVRIFAGGKLGGYLGKMPGVLEEFLIAIDLNKPIYLAGGLGGLCQKLCDSILNNEISEEFTEEWQISHNARYIELQQIAKGNSFEADYEQVETSLLSLSVEKLSSKSGLSEKEYTRLMTTPFVDEVVHLILKGLNQLEGKPQY